MEDNMKGRRPYFVLTLYVLLSVLLVLLIDFGVSATISNWRIIELLSHSEGNLAGLESELADLDDHVRAMEVTTRERHNKARPSLDEFRQLASDHRLRFRQLERISGSNASSGYSAALRGGIKAVVGFMKALEDSYLLEADYVLLKPANDDGSLVELSLQLETSGS